MGMRSMNALVVLRDRLPAEVKPYLAEALVAGTPKGALYVWETNISPLWARHSVVDLQEEAVILGWLLTLPKADYKLIRNGDELGELGELDITSPYTHPFSDTDMWVQALADYRKECDEVLARQQAETSVKEVLSITRENLLNAVTAVARDLGEVSFRTSHAEGMWGLIQDCHGKVRLGGYAVEANPAGALLEELPAAILLMLAEELEKLQAKKAGG